MRVVNQSIEDSIGNCWIADDVMPVVQRKLASDDRGRGLVSMLQYFQEVAPLFVSERSERKVIEDNELTFCNRCQKPSVAPIGFRD